ncbi:MAG: transketolase [Desulfohalobiaceae bacterium]
MQDRKKVADALRMLSLDAVQKAESGHPGAPMGMADIAQVLWSDFLRHNPADPSWVDRDRFVLSNGHASMLLYSLLHLTGYDLSLEELKRFRQLGSKTPGHPEYGMTPGVETTTGPLGQGLGNAAGMAVAERLLAARFNTPEYRIVDHYTYVFAGDGCLMEGISHEVGSLAGTLGLGKLIMFYDDNEISIDGNVRQWFNEDVAARFSSYGWQVIPAVDGQDPQAVSEAVEQAKRDGGRPSLICCKTLIACGSPNMSGSHKTHGAPLGEDEVEATRKNLGWDHPPFDIPREVYDAWDARETGRKLQKEWEDRFAAYEQENPQLAKEFKRCMKGDLPEGFRNAAQEHLDELVREEWDLATRKASQAVLERLGPQLPELVGGSADLSGSNSTLCSSSCPVEEGRIDGNYVYYGVREMGMAAMANGIALHGGCIPYCGTFLVFSDYARAAIRLAALSGIRSIFVLTHDSIGVGEDGPTHQPVEHMASLRMIPGLRVWRPSDVVETQVAWRMALETGRAPSALVLSRQKVTQRVRNLTAAKEIERGGYILLDPQERPELVIVATGSEVEPAVRAAKQLDQEGRRVRVVSMPCLEVFESQEASYRNSVLPQDVPRLVVEAGTTEAWYKYVGSNGAILGLDRFGESAPGGELFKHFGLDTEGVLHKARELLRRS